MKKKVFVTRFLKIGSLLLAVLVFIGVSQKYVFRTLGHDATRIEGFYMEPENSLDVVLLGASDVFTSFSSGKAYEMYGFTSYPYGIDSNRISSWSTSLKEIRRCQSPKLIVVEVNGALYGDSVDLYEDIRVRYVLESIPCSKEKVQAISLLGRTDSTLSYYLPFIKHHGNWVDAKDNISKCRDLITLKRRGYSLLKGEKTDTAISPSKPRHDVHGDFSTLELSAESEELLRAFLKECKDKGTNNILFVRVPHRIASDIEYSAYQRANRAGEIIAEYGYDFINFEQDYEEIGLDFDTDFYNDSHMNVDGQEKFTRYFGRILQEDYGIQASELTDDLRRQWDECAEYTDLYYRYARECNKRGEDRYLVETADLIHKLDKLKETA